MSGGAYDYQYFKLETLADDIERDFINDGKHQIEDWASSNRGFNFGKPRPMIDADRIEDATPEQRPIILAEIKSLIIELRKCAKRAKELEWYMSGDTGATSYLERLKEIK